MEGLVSRSPLTLHVVVVETDDGVAKVEHRFGLAACNELQLIRCKYGRALCFQAAILLHQLPKI
jgi:hypothetical protein